MGTKAIKLNLGSGVKPLEGYHNLDIHSGEKAYPISYLQEGATGWVCPNDESVDEVRASHILEHFPHGETQAVLVHWVTKLKPGGVLKIAVPDFQKIAQAYLHQRDVGYNAPAEGYIMGGQIDEHDFHKALFDEPGLRKMMAGAGLVDIRSWTSEIADCAALPISLNLMGTKPPLEQLQTVAYTDRRVPSEGSEEVPPAFGLEPKASPIKLAAVMSVPRLSITNNVASMYRAIRALGITCKPAQGVFWHHALTRQIEDRIADGFDYLLAVDYDSWFLPGHVVRLVDLLVHTPQADAICAVQCEREGELPIMGIHDESGLPVTSMPRAWFENPLTRIHTGHFGLTLFRAKCFAQLGRPWFRDEPDPNGSYRDGRQDADVAFWGNFERSGCQLYMANEVSIGHLQEICTFAGPAAKNWGALHVYLRDLNAGQMPAHCDPAYRFPNKDPILKE